MARGLHEDVVVLDGEVSNSTHAEDFKKTAADRFFEMYIAEQQMVAAAVGMQVVGLVPFASTFATFMTRAFDFIRMAAISRANVRLCGSHSGVSIGEDGPSQMALEDLPMMLAVHGSTVLYPCDASQTARQVGLMTEREGISYLRTTREKTPILYIDRLDDFRVGGSRIVRGGEADDAVVVVAAGTTIHEVINAADELKDTIKVRVIDAYSVKPIDAAALIDAVRVSQGRVCAVEDHWPEDGLGDAVLAALSDAGVMREVERFVHLAARDMPGSGKPAELLDAAGISAEHIADAVRRLADVDAVGRRAATVPKIRRVRAMLDRLRPACELEVDGGIHAETAALAVGPGAHVLVAGSAIFEDPSGVRAGMARLRASVAGAA